MAASLGDAGAFARLDRAKFFDAIRPLFKSLSQSQVDGIGRLLDAFLLYAVILDRRHLAYVLATSFHETGRRMQPVRETFASSTAQAVARLDTAFAAGKMRWVKTPYWRQGWFGRGDVQLTHEANYKGRIRDAVLKVFGVDIGAIPDLVLRGDISAFVLIEGITRGVTGRSDFTSSALEDFLNATKTDYDGARRTVNPNEKDSYAKVGGYARAFEQALIAGGMPALGVRLPKALGTDVPVAVTSVPEVVAYVPPPLPDALDHIPVARPANDDAVKPGTIHTGGLWSAIRDLFTRKA